MKNLERRWMAGLLALSLLLGMPALAVETPASAAPSEEIQVSPWLPPIWAMTAGISPWRASP